MRIRVLWEMAVMVSIGVILSSVACPYLFNEAIHVSETNMFVLGGGLYGLLSYGCWWLTVNSSLNREEEDAHENLQILQGIISFFLPVLIGILVVGTIIIFVVAVVGYIALPSWRNKSE
jgi:high-affinity Fe2+/Pb2+ permease